MKRSRIQSARKILIDIEDPRAVCPICGARLVWSCPAQVGTRGSANCAKGVNVSQRAGTHAYCQWPGTRVYRLDDGSVAIKYPISKRGTAHGPAAR